MSWRIRCRRYLDQLIKFWYIDGISILMWKVPEFIVDLKVVLCLEQAHGRVEITFSFLLLDFIYRKDFIGCLQIYLYHLLIRSLQRLSQIQVIKVKLKQIVRLLLARSRWSLLLVAGWATIAVDGDVASEVSGFVLMQFDVWCLFVVFIVGQWVDFVVALCQYSLWFSLIFQFDEGIRPGGAANNGLYSLFILVAPASGITKFKLASSITAEIHAQLIKLIITRQIKKWITVDFRLSLSYLLPYIVNVYFVALLEIASCLSLAETETVI